jgi:glycosyltransferase involved in cell wall biosynthesis
MRKSYIKVDLSGNKKYSNLGPTSPDSRLGLTFKGMREKETEIQTVDSLDVVVLTKNSERMLEACLVSIYRNVPVNNLIIVDGFSTDATLNIVGRFQKKHGNVILIQDRGTRGSARQKAISRVKTDWFMFVDSDVILCEGWFDKARKLMKANVGAIWGMEIWSVLRKMKILNLFERVTMKIFEKRGGTHDLLVRTEAVNDIQIPSNLHTYEDSYIKSWICRKGYDVLPAYEPYCIHYRPEGVWTVNQSVRFIASDLKLAAKHPSLMLSYAFYAAIVLGQSVLQAAGTSRSR